VVSIYASFASFSPSQPQKIAAVVKIHDE
jgi:hypothetical protein